jgi:anaerobic magnesium-protoporphyrin IX monomethyl ester cyclase
MRIVLLYPPPWKITASGEVAPPLEEGPPAQYRPGDLDPDFHQTPYGLFSLGAQAIAAGHQVKVFNLSGYAWSEVEATIAALDADLFGLSCWTANRRGVDLVSRCIKRLHPHAHVVVGGPHATPLARELLQHYEAIDTVAVGESEQTFLELIAHLAEGRAPRGIAGTFYRQGSDIIEAPERHAIKDLDPLASPHDYFDTHILMTSRGCPWQCTFCGAETTWGRGFRGRSVPKVLDDIEHALARLPVKMIQIKDDTFTANRKRALQICEGIRERGLNFVWSCDTRVDVLSEDLLRAMRLAGCERLSLGVESGSQTVLDNINKKITVQQIIASTELARKFGIQVRYYMMLGNRGETKETFRQTLDFLERARPDQYIFSCLSIYPGTLDFHEAERTGMIDRSLYFTETFQELKTPFDADAECTELMTRWFEANKGLRELQGRGGVAGARAVLENLGGEHHAAHLDLAAAHYEEREFEQAATHARRALELGHPLPGLCHNYLACCAFARGDLKAMQDHFMTAARTDPQHYVLMGNVERTRTWFRQNGPALGLPLTLHARHDFQLLERTAQPTLPGPLPEGFADWGPDSPPPASLGADGSRLAPARHLPLVSRRAS